MAKITLILGGAKSGKSSYAVALAKKIDNKVVFIATAKASDREMKNKISRHRTQRPGHWRLIEENKDIISVLSKIQPKYSLVLIDCLGLWLSSLLDNNLNDREIEEKIKKFINTILQTKLNIIIVSNEVGGGIVPDNPLARRFRDLLGFGNQMVAKSADEVISMQAGIAIKIK